uniref:Ig-like domain-containing protein n=1 Tax=Amphiprion percula TaxID=161767 RepID=A0A3P8S0D3_AMPPE
MLHCTADMTQLSNTNSSCKVRWKMWLFKVFVVTYLTAVCAAQDVPDATFVPTAAPPTTALQEVTTTAYVPPVPVLQQTSGWLEIFPSEKVKFSCTISGSSDWTFTWYRNGDKIDADANFSFPGDGSVLTITAATNSGKYTCKGQHKTKSVMTQSSNSLELKVHANRPKPKLSRGSDYQEMFPGESITFACLVDMSVGWQYLWYHNGREIPAADRNMYTIEPVAHSDNGQYHCKAKRGKDQFYTEESEPTHLRVSDPPTPTLKLLSTWSDVFEGEIVEFSCEVSSSDWMSKWYRNEVKLQEDEDTIVDEEGLELNITSVTKAHQGDYVCRAQLILRRVTSGASNSINIKVYDDVPTATLSKDGFNPMYVGETVNFTCKVTVSSGWTYQWYKDENELPDTSETISIFLGLSDKGRYSCKGIRGDTTETKPSQKTQQDVLEIPVPSLKNVTQWLDVFPTESVKLRCGMQSGSGWTYTWYKDKLEVQADNTVLFDSNRATLSINSAVSGKHNGLYECKGHLQDRTVKSISSSPLRLMVYDKKPAVILTQDPEYKVMFPGESVSFSCHINVSSGWEYLWYKDGSSLAAPGNIYSISPVEATSRGSYTCQVRRGSNSIFTTDLSQVIRLEVEKKKPKPLMTQQPAADKLYAGEPVSFECKVGISSGWNYYWYKDGVPFVNNSSSFQIVNATLLNSGYYECKAIRSKMFNTERSDRRNLRISEIPVPSLKNETQWLDVFPTEGVKFRCEMPTSSDWTYTWYKDTQEVQADANMFDKGDTTTLIIHSASALHRGKYSCSGKLKIRSVKTSPSSELRLDVYDTKPRVTLMQNPEHSLMHTEDKVSFSCHINVSSGWEFLWYKNNIKLQVSGVNHNISSVTRANAGLYKCKAERGTKMVFNTASQTLKLDVEERPQASITLLTGWGEAFSTDSLVLQCEVTDDQYKDWNYTWFRGDQLINTSLSVRYTVTPNNDPDQSTYTCKGIRTERPAYSKISAPYKTRNLLLKRRVLLSITGVLFFGIVAVLLGCISLRFIRKPADDDDKPEEANLFLTMAQLKDCADAPCPLVEYVTDADVNPPSKEGDENGTICSETTPLPITSPEDKAVMSDNHDTTENNGGLVSFQQ